MIAAPGGWGYPPGFPLDGVDAEALPEKLPEGVNTTHRLRQAVRFVSPMYRHRITCRHLMDRYGVSRSLAYDALMKAKAGPRS